MQFVINHPDRSALYIVFKPAVRLPEWTDRKHADEFNEDDIGGAIVHLAKLGYKSLLIEVAEDE